MNCQPVIIVGAGRSGTNILRDTLVSLGSCATWPCDEINYIWRYGNRAFPTDEIPKSRATVENRNYIRSHFDAISTEYDKKLVVEKTCANSLRVPFVDEVVPEAKYLCITRDGADVVSSAMNRWTAELDVNYLLKKARYVPKGDIPYYAFRYASHRARKLFSNSKSLPTWGPIYDGMRDDAKSFTLAELCAKQWGLCVRHSLDALATFEQERVFHVRYEEFVTNPAKTMSDVCEFLGVVAEQREIESAVVKVTDKSVGNGAALGQSDPKAMEILSMHTDKINGIISRHFT